MDPRITSTVRTVVEALEARRLLASISGTVFEDLNADSDRDGREKPLAGITVYLDLNNNNRLNDGEPSTVTDVNGFYEFTGLTNGTYVVRQISPKKYGQTLPGPTGLSAAGDYDLVIRFPDSSISTLIRGLFESAASRWERVLVGDLTSQATDVGQVDDMVIDALADAVDGAFGILAFASPTQLRPEGDPDQFLPVRGSMTFDTADIDDPGLYETILHEMGHALGFTANIWDSLGLVTGLGLAAPRFLGENATAAYNEIFFGITDSTDPEYRRDVPLEGNQSPPGSRDSHWRESVFDTELMTPYSEGAATGEPLSRVTVAAFQDMGYTVNPGAADDFDPNNTFPTPARPGGGTPFGYSVTIDQADDAIQGRDFANRLNRAPLLDSVKTKQALFLVGERVKLQAYGARDLDDGDNVIAVNFYMETNGIPGLQTGTGGDKFIAQDNTFAGGYRTVIDTGATGLGLSPGAYTFYARAYDEAEFTSAVQQTSFNLFDPTQPPARPVNLRTTAVSSSQIEVTWTDKADNEFGYRLERALNPDFAGRVQRFTLPADATAFTDTGLAASTRYYYRIRAFNIGMTDEDTGTRTQFSRASSPAGATTLANGEVVIDSAAGSDLLSTAGNVETLGSYANAVGGSALQLAGSGAVARFAPPLPASGDWYVYARWVAPNAADGNRARFTVTDALKVTRDVVIDQARRGGLGADVLIGKFNFRAGNRTVLTLTPAGSGDVITIDAVRFKSASALPASVAVAPAATSIRPRAGIAGEVL